MLHMFARQINDFETRTYAITETTFLFSSNLLLKLNTIQAKQITLFLAFFFLSHFFFSKELYSFSLFFFSSPLFFFYNYNKNKMLPHTCFLVLLYNFRSKEHKKSLSLSCKHNKTRMRWCGWTKEMTNEWSVQKGFLKFVFRWIVNTLAMVLN